MPGMPATQDIDHLNHAPVVFDGQQPKQNTGQQITFQQANRIRDAMWACAVELMYIAKPLIRDFERKLDNEDARASTLGNEALSAFKKAVLLDNFADAHNSATEPRLYAEIFHCVESYRSNPAKDREVMVWGGDHMVHTGVKISELARHIR